MNQTLRTSSIRFHEPVELPLPGSPTILIADHRSDGHIVEAVPCADTQGYYAGRWLVVERDPSANLIRESTATYAHPKLAYYAYWHASADDPLDFEAWVSPIWATAFEPCSHCGAETAEEVSFRCTSFDRAYFDPGQPCHGEAP